MALLTNINGKFSVSDAGAVTFNNAFTFPTVDGTANYVLKTNGSGQLTWGPDNDSGGDITGSGTANTVTKFTGAKVIGNGPITFSGNNSTFTGNIDVNGTASDIAFVGGSMNFKDSNDYIRITKASASAQLGLFRSGSGGGGMYIGGSDSGFRIYTDGFSQKFLLDQSGNATFAGEVTAVKYNVSSTSGYLVRENTGSGYGLFKSSTTNIGIASNGNVALNFDSSSNATFSGNLRVDKSAYQAASGGGYIGKPYGGNFYTTQNVYTGAIEVVLPTGGTGHDDMLKFVIDIFDYATQESVTVFVGGYTYQNVGSGNVTWTNVQAQVIGQSANQNYTVRFGDNGTSHCVWVGDTNSSWNHLQVIVRDFFVGYGANISNWIGAWGISVVTTQTTINNTLTNNFPMSSGDVGGPYLPLTGGTLSGNLIVNGSNTLSVGGNITANDGVFILGTSYWVVSSSDAALQRADARDDATNYSRLHWYGESDTGATSNFRHAYYDGSSYIDVTAASGVLNFTGQLETTTLRTDVINNKANSANIIYRSGTNTIVGGGSGSNKLYVNDDGNVGIGTPDPDHKLEILGGLAIRNNNSRLYFGANNGTDRRALEGNTSGTLLQVGESYSNTQIYNDVQVTGNIRPGEGIMMGASSGYQIPVAYSVGNAGTTNGAIKIQLPQAMTNTMMMFKVRVYEYGTWEAFDVTICGYNYAPTSTWYNVSAWIDSHGILDRNFTVRLGYDATATRCVAYIGELNSTWTYPQVWVTEWNGGHSNQGANWHYNYQISFETSSFIGITQTITGTQINNWVRAGGDLYSGGGVGNVGINKSNPQYKLDVGGQIRAEGIVNIGGLGVEASGALANIGIDDTDTNGTSTSYQSNITFKAAGTVKGKIGKLSNSTNYFTAAKNFDGPVNIIASEIHSGHTHSQEYIFGYEPANSGNTWGLNIVDTATTPNSIYIGAEGLHSTSSIFFGGYVNALLVTRISLNQSLGTWLYDCPDAGTSNVSVKWRKYNTGGYMQNMIDFEDDGDIKNINGSYGTISSDERVKENIVDATSKLDDILSLKVKNFNFIGDNKKQIGLIAQEVEEIFPSWVNTRDTRIYKTHDEDGIPLEEQGELVSGYEDGKSLKVGMEFAILTKAIQEQQEIIESLKQRIEQLEN